VSFEQENASRENNSAAMLLQSIVIISYNWVTNITRIAPQRFDPYGESAGFPFCLQIFLHDAKFGKL
jgi:hypothetical protein